MSFSTSHLIHLPPHSCPTLLSSHLFFNLHSPLFPFPTHLKIYPQHSSPPNIKIFLIVFLIFLPFLLPLSFFPRLSLHIPHPPLLLPVLDLLYCHFLLLYPLFHLLLFLFHFPTLWS